MKSIRVLKYTITQEHNGKTVQDFLIGEQGYSRRIITRLKQNRGDILLNGEHIRMVDPIHEGDIIQVSLHEETYIHSNSELQVPIIYEDDDVIVYNKPANMPVHPSRNHQYDTLANAFCYHMEQKHMRATFRPINRLDRDTSGLVVVAKNALSASKLSGAVEKEYTAIVCGKVTPLEATIDAPIIRLDDFHIKRGVDKNGQRCVTHYKVELQNEKYSLVRIHLETGRTHQIRVHFSHIGYPLAGDDMYGGDMTDIKRQALCCNEVLFLHPQTNSTIKLCINIHDDMNKLVQCE
ncbi:RluA family pseudouridine synthase [Paludicola sp. MB14-C6]|uniref:RluA family pseudouridine synthase n=1 Tax=Paludihabitans sp. MB14-C6 TaxID=3070656 RepID=UPI0027DE6EEF|nr:RluA family pseudouridine synthase [Paludicola sp. MB14-C6]WMJ21999.1 RluA family pseudouridine synthase [Paludicola sp. MB14-C6]